MKLTPINIRCPACTGTMTPVTLRCEPCNLNITGAFITNEFANLTPEDLHFLRIFVHCEGRIRDMESALGVSYPTIKGRLAKLKVALGETADQTPPASTKEVSGSSMPAVDAAAVIHELESGRMSFSQAMEHIRGGGRGEGAV